MNSNILALLLPLLGLALCPSSLATTVYKTVDDKGVVSFSDTPPVENTDVETLKIAAPERQPTDEYQQNLEAMRETTDRMAEDRREREKHRAEMRELAAKKKQQQQDYYSYAPYSPGYVRTYGRSRRNYYNDLLPWYPDHGLRPIHPIAPGPVHPIVRPPLAATPRVNLGGNHQLMRPLVSPRR